MVSTGRQRPCCISIHSEGRSTTDRLFSSSLPRSVPVLYTHPTELPREVWLPHKVWSPGQTSLSRSAYCTGLEEELERQTTVLSKFTWYHCWKTARGQSRDRQSWGSVLLPGPNSFSNRSPGHLPWNLRGWEVSPAPILLIRSPGVGSRDRCLNTYPTEFLAPGKLISPSERVQC